MAHDDEMSDAELKLLQGRIARLMDKEIERALGFIPQFPSVIMAKALRCNCGPIFHRADCKYSCTS